MNSRTQRPRNPDPAIPDVIVDEREWLAQEQAARAERLGMAGERDGDPLVASYRDVSRALRTVAGVDGPPPDFASHVARAAAKADAAEDRFERIVLHVMTAALGVSMGAVLVLHGRGWVQATLHAASGGTLQWTALVAACAGLHWLLERLRMDRAGH